jgi:hypothetical protein
MQQCFEEAKDVLESEGKQEEAEGLRIGTVHWLRHMGISEDVKRRPREQFMMPPVIAQVLSPIVILIWN